MFGIGKKDLFYTWSGVNLRGKELSDEALAPDKKTLIERLNKKGIINVKVKRKTFSMFSQQGKKPNTGDIAVFSRQLSTMSSAGIPITNAIGIIARSQDKLAMKLMLLDIEQQVGSGIHINDALATHPKYFDPLFCNLVSAGEQSGKLTEILQQISYYKEKIESTKRKVKKALTYPIAVIVIAIAISLLLLLFIVPQFKELFDNFNTDLPLFTQLILDLSNLIQRFWYIVLIISVVIISLILKLKAKSERFAYLCDKLILKVFIIGPILKKAMLARVCQTLSITIDAGLPLVEALDSVASVTGNKVYTKAFFTIKEEVSAGDSFNKSLADAAIFPPLVTQMATIGEESGSLSSMLAKISEFYEEQVDTSVDSLSSLLEPIIMVVLGVIIGSFIVAMYLPIFQLGSIV